MNKINQEIITENNNSPTTTGVSSSQPKKIKYPDSYYASPQEVKSSYFNRTSVRQIKARKSEFPLYIADRERFPTKEKLHVYTLFHNNGAKIHAWRSEESTRIHNR